MNPESSRRSRSAVQFFRGPGRHARATRRGPLALESLEPRTLLTAPFSLYVSAPGAPHVAPLLGTVTTGGPDTSPVDDENTRAGEPAQVTGAFLTDGAVARPGDTRAMAFYKVIQGFSDTCTFASVLSAVALTNFDLESGITVKSVKSPSDIVYNVRLFEPTSGGGLQAIEIPEEFIGVINPADAGSSIKSEFWPGLYQRAYLSLEGSLGLDFHKANNAFRALTGVADVAYGAVATTATITPSWLLSTLNGGSPVVAATVNSPDPYTLAPDRGIIGNHSYTVLGIQVPADGAKAGTYVTLRNPWGADSTAAYTNTIDSDSDGIIRVPWSVFSQYFGSVVVSTLTGPSINTPQDRPPTFNHAPPATITVFAGQTVGPIDLSATDPLGRPVYYYIANNPGSLSPSGQFSWRPLPNEVGTYRIKITSGGSPSVSSETFSINVLPNVPSIASISASPTTISAAGTDRLTLAASGVAAPAGMVQSVTFYLDVDNLGTFLQSRDTYLGFATAATGFSTSTFIGGVDPGTYKVFAVASSLFNGLPFTGAPVSTTLTVAPAPVYEPLVNAFTDQVQASPDSPAFNVGLGVTIDSASESRVFWEEYGSPNRQYVREYDRRGDPLTGPLQLAVIASYYMTIAGMPDGSFYEVYVEKSGAAPLLKVQHYFPTAAIDGSPVVVADLTSAGAPFQDYNLQAASDARGNLLVAYNLIVVGTPHSTVNVYALTVSAAGAVTRAPWMVNSAMTGDQRFPSVALDPLGAGVIAWADRTGTATLARRVTDAGLFDGPILTVYFDPANPSGGASAAVDRNGNITLAYSAGGNIHAHRYGGDRASDSGDFIVFANLNDINGNARVAVNGEGWAYVAWDDSAYGPSGAETLGKLIDPMGRVESTFHVAPQVLIPTSLAGLAFGDNGGITVAFRQTNVNDQSQTDIDFRLYVANMQPVFQGPYDGFTVPLGSAVGTAVGVVRAIDPNNDQLSYRLLGPSPFAVDFRSGSITVADAAALKLTSVTKYVLSIQVDDSDPTNNVLPVTTVIVTIVDNTPPTIEALPDRTVDANEAVAARIVGNDPAGAALTYSVAIAGGGPVPAMVVIVGDVLVVTPTKDYLGSFRVNVTATNGLALGSRSFLVTVVSPSLGPVPDQVIDDSPSTSSVRLAGIDASGAALTYSASVAGSGPPPATFAFDNNVMTITPVPGYTGAFTVSASVSIGPDTATRSFAVTVRHVNRAPVLDPLPDRSVVAGQALSFRVAATDADRPAEILTFTLVDAPDGANLNPQSGDFSWTPSGGRAPGRYPITIRVADDASPPLSDTRTWFAIVTPPIVAGNPGTLQFSRASVSGDEDKGSALVEVVRSAGSAGVVSVLVSVGGDAVSGVNFAPFMQTLTFAAGETTKAFLIPLLHDGAFTADRSIVLTLSSPSGGAALGALATASLIIRNIDPPPTVKAPLVTLGGVRTIADKHKNVTQVIVSLSDAVDPARAANIATYRLATAGKKGSFDTKGFKTIKLRSATYNPSSKTVTLTLAKPLNLSKTVQLRIDGSPSGLTDSLGRPIDGNRDGQAGGDAVALLDRRGVSISRSGLRGVTSLSAGIVDSLLDRGDLDGLVHQTHRKAR